MPNISPKPVTHLEIGIAMAIGIVGVDSLCWWGVGEHTLCAVAMVWWALFAHWFINWLAEWGRL